MNTHISRFVVVALVIAGFLGGAQATHAMTPTVSFSAQGGGDLVQITVVGDAYANVTLSYQKINYGTQTLYLGTTNASGYFNTTVSTNTNSISAGSLAYVTVNSQQSTSVAWPYGTTTGGAVTLSQYAITTSVGQSVSVYISGGSLPYTMSTIGSPNIFQPVLSGSTLMIQGLVAGTSSVNICSTGGFGCATLTVTVGTGTTYGSLYLSQSNVTLNVSGSTSVTITGSGGYYIANNSNASITSSYISGSTLYVTGSNYGSNTISVCQTGGQCATLYVTVNYGTSVVPVSAVTFSQANPVLNIGQSVTLAMYGGLGSAYYIAFNSNSGALSAIINGSNITVTVLSNTAPVVVVCTSANNCGALIVTVSGNTVGSGNWTYCAKEGARCNYTGTQTVRYGANGAYYYRTYTNGLTCNNANFGDPISGVVKQCYYGGMIYVL